MASSLQDSQGCSMKRGVIRGEGCSIYLGAQALLLGPDLPMP